jgi:type II secretory ATPase GspE/PulE/Tfp pilus assembly ATPase PilB-like protein
VRDVISAAVWAAAGQLFVLAYGQTGSGKTFTMEGTSRTAKVHSPPLKV